MYYANNLQDGDVIIRRHQNGWVLINVDDEINREETITLFQDVLEEQFMEGDILPATEALANCLKTAFAEYTFNSAYDEAGLDFTIKLQDEDLPEDIEE